ncbi:MAG: zf-HC2 domain-containing protein [bacterium]|nr:zf-HC2 domain-containing protein [bacterium]
MNEQTNHHELLPWYVTGALEAAEAASFERHLEACASCRDEVELLGSVRTEAGVHGAEFFDDHPSPDDLIDALADDLPQEQSRRVLRHVAICSACSTEARWIRGEEIVGGNVHSFPAPQSAPAARSAWWGWVAAAAALTLLVVNVATQRGSEPTSGVVQSLLVSGAERGASGAPRIVPAPDARSFELVFDLALRESAFPLTVELVDERGALVHRETDVPFAALREAIYLHVVLDARDFPAGRYVARIRSADTDIPDERPFRVDSP